MIDSKLIQLLRVLDKKQYRKLRAFSKVNLFNTKEQVSILFDYFAKSSCVPLFDDRRKLRKQLIYQKVFKQKNYSDQKMRTLMSNALKVVRQFIVMEQLQENQDIQHDLLLEFYSKANLKRHFIDELEAYYKWNENLNLLSTTNLYTNFKFSVFESSFMSNQEQLDEQMPFEAVFKALDLYYYAIQLRYACNLQLRQFVQKVVNPLPQIHELYQNVATNDLLFHQPIIRLYYYILSFLIHEDGEKYFKEYINLLKEKAAEMENNHKYEFFNYAFTFAILQINKGLLNYNEPLLELYKDALQMNALYEGQFIPSATFRNIVTHGLRVKAFDWLTIFIDEYHHQLPPEQRNDAYQFNLAKLHFAQKQYDKALELLLQINYVDRHYQIDAKRLLCKIYYEQEAISALEAALDSLYMMMYRDQTLAERTIQNNRNFVLLMRRLVKILPSEKERLQDLLEMVHNTTLLAERRWLLEMIEGEL